MSNDLWVVGDRHAIRLSEVKSLKIEPFRESYSSIVVDDIEHRCFLTVGGLATYLYPDEVAARIDFDKIIRGKETVHLSGRWRLDSKVKTNGVVTQ